MNLPGNTHKDNLRHGRAAINFHNSDTQRHATDSNAVKTYVYHTGSLNDSNIVPQVASAIQRGGKMITGLKQSEKGEGRARASGRASGGSKRDWIAYSLRLIKSCDDGSRWIPE